MLSCKEVVRQSTDYVDGKLGFWARLNYRFHLLLCFHCRRYMRHFKTTIEVSRECGRQPLANQQAETIARQVEEKKSP